MKGFAPQQNLSKILLRIVEQFLSHLASGGAKI